MATSPKARSRSRRHTRCTPPSALATARFVASGVERVSCSRDPIDRLNELVEVVGDRGGDLRHRIAEDGHGVVVVLIGKTGPSRPRLSTPWDGPVLDVWDSSARYIEPDSDSWI